MLSGQIEHAQEIKEAKAPYLEALAKYKEADNKVELYDEILEMYNATYARIEELHSDYICNNIHLLFVKEDYDLVKEVDFDLEKPTL